MMEAIGFVFLAAVIMCLYPIFAVALGAFAGVVAGWIAPESMQIVCDLIGAPTSGHAGAALGFIGGFFKATTSSN